MKANITWDDNAWLLRAKTDSDETIFTWTYPMFEDWMGRAIRPSEYVYMTNYVDNKITGIDLAAICRAEYNPGPLCSRAVDAYLALADEDKIDWHCQTIYQIQGHLKEALSKEEAAMGWILSVESDTPMCISDDMCTMARQLIVKYREKCNLCDRMMAEEENV